MAPATGCGLAGAGGAFAALAGSVFSTAFLGAGSVFEGGSPLGAGSVLVGSSVLGASVLAVCTGADGFAGAGETVAAGVGVLSGSTVAGFGAGESTTRGFASGLCAVS